MPWYTANNEETFPQFFEHNNPVYKFCYFSFLYFCKKNIQLWDLPTMEENVMDYFQYYIIITSKKKCVSGYKMFIQEQTSNGDVVLQQAIIKSKREFLSSTLYSKRILWHKIKTKNQFKKEHGLKDPELHF